MNVLQSFSELSAIHGPAVLAIGVFDGVHLGHRAVIERALADARQVDGTAVVVTFDPHPARILRPEHAPRLLTSTGHKIRLIRALGVEHLLIIPFTTAFAATAPEEFIRILAHACRPLKEICVGHQWSFGKGRAGNLDLLKRLGNELGFDEVGVQPVKIQGQIVSSTLIRGAVESGDLASAALFLGRAYPILGTVMEGDRLGRTLGFPTANLGAHNEQFPPNGVYAVDAHWCGQTFRGVANIGVRPTVASASGQRLIEVHLFDFNAEIYGEDIEVTFRRFLRPEKKFGSLDELRAQISADAAEARATV